jgi:hypothetical protein
MMKYLLSIYHPLYIRLKHLLLIKRDLLYTDILSLCFIKMEKDFWELKRAENRINLITNKYLDLIYRLTRMIIVD